MSSLGSSAAGDHERRELAPLTRVFKLDTPRGGFVFRGHAASLTIYGHDDLIEDLLRLLQEASAADLASQLGLRHDFDKASSLLRVLTEKGILRASDSIEHPPADELLVSLAGYNALSTPISAPDISLTLLGTGTAVETLMDLADGAGLHVSRGMSKDTSIVAAVCDQPDFEFFRRCNLEAAVTRPIAIFGYIDHVEANIFSGRIGSSACFECAYHRLRSSRRFVAEFDATHAGSRLVLAGPTTPPRIMSSILAGAMLTRVLSIHMGADPSPHEATFRSFSSLSGEMNSMPIWKLPRCPVCGSANLVRPMPGAFFLREPVRADAR